MKLADKALQGLQVNLDVVGQLETQLKKGSEAQN